MKPLATTLVAALVLAAGAVALLARNKRQSAAMEEEPALDLAA